MDQAWNLAAGKSEEHQGACHLIPALLLEYLASVGSQVVKSNRSQGTVGLCSRSVCHPAFIDQSEFLALTSVAH